MHLKIVHLTEYTYDGEVSYALQQLRLMPKTRSYQQVVNWQTSVEGGAKQVAFQDQHDNHVDLISVDPGSRKVTVRSEGEVETTGTSGVYGAHHGYVPLWLFLRPTRLTDPGPLLGELAGSVRDAGDGEVAQLHALSAQIHSTITYETGRTQAESTAEQALALGHGVCQDHAHAFVAAARLLDIPARYVSGYLMMNDRVEQDASHAWAEAHVDGIGWIGFDVSNGISPDERYVRLATGLDYTDAAPISGMRFGNTGESMLVSVQVQQQ